MDPALLRERELFQRRAFAVPVIETKKRKDEGASGAPDAKRLRPGSSDDGQAPPAVFPGAARQASLNAAASAFKFGVLTKIVKHLRQKFQDGEDSPLALEEILDETNQLDVSGKTRQWLMTEALPNNPKIDVNLEGKFQFKPPLKCRDKKSLLRLLKQHDMKGLGGILRDDVVESVPHAERVLKALDSEIITIPRQDKKKVLFYNDRHAELIVDDEFQKLWRSVAVDGIDDAKIEEYLDKQGIRSMQDQSIKKTVQPIQRRKAQRKKMLKKPKDNEHIADDLKVYDD